MSQGEGGDENEDPRLAVALHRVQHFFTAERDKLGAPVKTSDLLVCVSSSFYFFSSFSPPLHKLSLILTHVYAPTHVYI
jgi:hypothetical protein